MAKKRVYNNDNVIITVDESINVNDKTNVEITETESRKNNVISTHDIIDTFAGYILPQFSFASMEDETGMCVICNKQTSNFRRKLCPDCMAQHKETIYNQLKEKIDNITIDLVI